MDARGFGSAERGAAIYSPNVIDKSQWKLEKQLNIKLKRYEPHESWAVTESIGFKPRALNSDEQAFVLNETLLSKIDFKYFVERFCSIEIDGGGAGVVPLRESQLIVLERYLAKWEDQVVEAVEKKEPTDGIRFYWHKARQLYATTTARELTLHRLIFNNDIRAMVAPASEDQIIRLYDRDKRLYDGLPWWLRPSISDSDGGFDVKGQHIYFAGLKSSLTYYSGTKKSGMGQGSQFQIQHLTEAAFWPTPEHDIDYVLDPTLPQSPQTLAIRESTANGRGNWWHVNTEDARHGRTSWGYVFIPWYAVSMKRRRKCPSYSWQPDKITRKHAEMVLETSPEWIGKRIKLDFEQMYWWESERKEYQRKQGLAVFFTNYAACPEESFQHSENAAFTPEMIEKWRSSVTIPPVCLEVVTNG